MLKTLLEALGYKTDEEYEREQEEKKKLRIKQKVIKEIKRRKMWLKELRGMNDKERLKLLKELLEKEDPQKLRKFTAMVLEVRKEKKEEDESLIGEPIAPCTGGRPYSEHYYRDLAYCDD